ncbi:hypothetical protein LH427_01880 [Laribacter hongkongensis]|uniref:hypothetical protein n=1 Tax=Laribacter hongkongensis TaxID=168471 RepID=UPI001EFD6BCB|nr:hypothetical protein [Laribacter hongkongensis]MCG8991805.1 hypothetical protein [Laribacter hongkongensis]MCG9000196.1 hypothetical protein [Laribacter hongkongensis]MCG9004447.1 hypothetical protein [Laribacter hongkongensis]MCG9013914.1 hypothetical protein [Laribacter hongkongensis]MCG9018613.1 hypothetical protein [Laribacter hongkongensis]
MHWVFSRVMWAVEVFEAHGIGCAGFEPRGSGGCAAGKLPAGADVAEAARILAAVKAMPEHWQVVTWCMVLSRQGVDERARLLVDWVSEEPSVVRWARWGRFGVEYMVWWWLERECGLCPPRGCGRSAAELAEICGEGLSSERMRQIWHESVKRVLDGWLVAAVGSLEPVCGDATRDLAVAI